MSVTWLARDGRTSCDVGYRQPRSVRAFLWFCLPRLLRGLSIPELCAEQRRLRLLWNGRQSRKKHVLTADCGLYEQPTRSVGGYRPYRRHFRGYLLEVLSE